MEKQILFAANIIKWHKKHGKIYPWRRTKNPFHILISEILLQKTDTKKVLSVYPIIVRKYPTPNHLASANLRALRKEIHLIGIHDRARRMKLASNMIMNTYDGKVPQNKKELMGLLGVGEYISNAVLCFAFNMDVPLLDSNIIRVIRRAFSVESKKERARTDKILWEYAANLVPKGKGIDYNRGILDFAAVICTSRHPKCNICPNKKICDYYCAVNSEATRVANSAGSLVPSITSPRRI